MGGAYGDLPLRFRRGEDSGRIERNFSHRSGSGSTGSVRLSDLSAGTLTVETTTGDLNLRGVAVEGALSAHTTTGDIRLERVDAASLAIAATTGDVTDTLCSEKRFAVHTGTGDVSVPATASGGVCEIETSTGDVHIELA